MRQIYTSYIFHVGDRHTHPSHILSFSSAIFFCKLIMLCLLFALCPDGMVSCSHNAVVIPPANGALALVNTLPIVSWTFFIPPAPVVPQGSRHVELDRLPTVQIKLNETLCAGQGNTCVVMIRYTIQYVTTSVGC